MSLMSMVVISCHADAPEYGSRTLVDGRQRFNQADRRRKAERCSRVPAPACSSRVDRTFATPVFPDAADVRHPRHRAILSTLRALPVMPGAVSPTELRFVKRPERVATDRARQRVL